MRMLILQYLSSSCRLNRSRSSCCSKKLETGFGFKFTRFALTRMEVLASTLFLSYQQFFVRHATAKQTKNS